MPTHELSGTTALHVTGASRGFGRAIAVALSKHGAHVAGVAREMTPGSRNCAHSSATPSPPPLPTPPTP